MDLVDRLAAHRTIGSAPREELEWIAAHGRIRVLAAGELLSSHQRPVEGLYFVLSGLVTIHVDRGAGSRRVMEWRGGDVTGVLPYSRVQKPPGDAVVEEAAEVLMIGRDMLPEFIRNCYVSTGLLVHVMTDRARQFAASDFHDEKMMSLGRLAAGLAHELNNPASAAARSAKLLVATLDDLDADGRALQQAHLSGTQLQELARLRAACLASDKPASRSAIETADREEAIAGWLAAHQVGSDIAAALAATPVSIGELDKLAAHFSGEQLTAALRWVGHGCATRGLAVAVEAATARIHDLVGAVKSFTFMDRGSVPEPIDVGKGLADTVAVLEGKAHRKQVSVSLNAAPDMPKLYATGGEFNQIWEKIIDNAIDAAPPGGHVAIHAAQKDRTIAVSIVDDGPGVAPDILPKIFEPFITNKPWGQGIGLGLSIARRLVAWHSGEIKVSSEPGRTEFLVTLPLSAERK
ncbi:MAG TPA: ATP-binding protein [Vicinamibacterales bacterium]|nr:ATP-binding protein [Vicinamibacterales bacterium]